MTVTVTVTMAVAAAATGADRYREERDSAGKARGACRHDWSSCSGCRHSPLLAAGRIALF